MPTSGMSINQLVLYIVPFLLLCLLTIAVFASRRRREIPMQASTNRLLFAIAILLFAVVFKLVSNGMDMFVLIIALVGLGVGWYGILLEPRS